MRLPLTLHLQSSRGLAAALTAAHAAVVAGLLATAIPLFVKLAAACIVALSAAFTLRRVLRPPFAAVTLRADGTIEALRADGSSAMLRVLADTTVFSWLVVLRLDGGDAKAALVLPPDAVADGGHRELRLWLRWKATSTA